jgi:tetratricopeptide (TPR) repeat protein
MQKSLAFFREAMALDPSYPLAYHGAALVSIFRCMLDDLRPREALAEADAYLQQGLDCPQQAGMVYNTLALLRTFERRWDEADEASRKALALEPENPNIRMVRAQLLSCLGRHDEAIGEASLAVDLDPTHLRSHMHLTKACFMPASGKHAFKRVRTDSKYVLILISVFTLRRLFLRWANLRKPWS